MPGVDLSTSSLLVSTLTDLQRRVLRAVADPGVEHFGTAIARSAGIRATSVYVVLRRLEDLGLVRETWLAEAMPDARGHRHRRAYTLTEYGAEQIDLSPS